MPWRALRVVAVWSGQASWVQVVKVESQLEPLRALCRQLQQEIELLGSRKIDPNLAQRIEQVRYPDPNHSRRFRGHHQLARPLDRCGLKDRAAPFSHH